MFLTESCRQNMQRLPCCCPVYPPQIFHYTGGVPYVDNKGPFRDRVEFVGNPSRRDGSILIKNLEFNDNGTFTCDAKNPPDIVGRPSSVRLLVFEKCKVGGGEAVKACLVSHLFCSLAFHSAHLAHLSAFSSSGTNCCCNHSKL